MDWSDSEDSKVIGRHVDIGEIKFNLMSGHGTTNTIFILRQLQQKHLAKKKNLYLAFVDLEKASDRGHWDIVWWAFRKLSIEE